MTDTAQDIGNDPEDPYYAGNSLEINESITDENGNALDLSNATVEWGVARRPGDSVVIGDGDAEVTLSIDTPASDGDVTVTVEPGHTSDMDGTYKHEFKVTKDDGTEDTVTRGDFEVTPTIIA